MSSLHTSTPPVRPAPNAPFHPHGDMATYRDLLLFEERLKMNAEMLRKRRRRYMGESCFPLLREMGMTDIIKGGCQTGDP